MTFTVPANLSPGNYLLHAAVTVNNETSATANSATGIDVLPPTPTITSFTPSTADQGASVAITGNGFTSTAANNIVKFGTITASVLASSSTSITVTVPSGLTVGSSYPITVAVTINGETSNTAISSSNFVLGVPPTVTTDPVTTFDEISATGTGNITASGSSSVILSGICWSTSANPTLNDHFTQNGGSSSITGSMTQLMPGTTYHVRAYASNSEGTGYGNDISFTTTSVVVPSGLLGYYKFNGNVLDYSGYGNNLTPTNVTYTSDRNSNTVSASVFDGSTSKALGSINFQNSSSMSISLWFYGISTNAWTIANETTSRFNVYDYSSNTGFGQCNPACEVARGSSASRSAWHHFVGTYDAPNSTMKYYLDDVLVASSAMTTGALFSTVNFNVGYNNLVNNATVNNYWQGFVDNLKIYNRVLSSSEVTQLYQEKHL